MLVTAVPDSDSELQFTRVISQIMNGRVTYTKKCTKMLCRMTVPHCDMSCFGDRAYRYNRKEKPT
jgi:hypothetical protein